MEEVVPGHRRSLVNFHSFRRCFITKAEQADQMEHIIAVVVGHKRTGMTLGRYSGGPLLEQAIPHSVRDHHPGQIARLGSVVKALELVRSLTSSGLTNGKDEEADAEEDGLSKSNTSDRAVWDASARRAPELAAGLAENASWNDMSALRQTFAQHRRKEEVRLIDRKGNLSAYRSETEEMDRNLKSVQAICSRWAWYSRKGKFNTLNSSRLLLPEPFPVNVVVLDATANQEVLWTRLRLAELIRTALGAVGIHPAAPRPCVGSGRCAETRKGGAVKGHAVR